MRTHDLIAILDGAHPKPPHPALQMLPDAGITAVLAARPRPVLRLPQGRADLLAEAAERLRLQEACLPLATLLPVQPGASLSLAGCGRFLQANQPLLAQLMQRYTGLVQVQITLRWQEEAVLTRFRDHPAVAALFTMPQPGPQHLVDAVSNLSVSLSARITDLLSRAAMEVITLPVAPSVLWNGVVLLPRTALSGLDTAVEKIDAIWSEGFTIRQIGPAPIASFALITLEPVTAAEVARARAAFGAAPSVHAGLRAGLMAAGDNAALREGLRRQARIAEAAARLSTSDAGFALAGVRSEGRSAPALLQQAVA